jgi:hypothetical protein
LAELDAERLGNRHQQVVLDDFDRVERLRAQDEMIGAGFVVAVHGNERVPAPSDAIRYYEVAETVSGSILDRRRRGPGKSGYLEKRGEYLRVKNRTERVEEVCEVLPYLIVQCDSHDRMTAVTPQARLHATLRFPRASAIEHAATVQCRYRACLRTETAMPPLPTPPGSWPSKLASP